MNSEQKVHLTAKYAKRWHWCTTCHCASVRYTCCGNSTCNCGGCSSCDETYDEVREMYREGLVPKITEIAGAVEAQRKSDLRSIKNHMNNGATPADVDEWLKNLKEQGSPCSFGSFAEIPHDELAAARDIADLLLGD